MTTEEKLLPQTQLAESAPDFLQHLLHEAESANASDIHLQTSADSAAVSFRLDGVLTPIRQIPAALAERVVGRIKFLARLKTYQESLPQDGRIDQTGLNARSDIRVSTYPTVNGEKVVLRLFNSSGVRSFDQLDFPAPVLSELERFLRQSSGLLLLTGPAGSGKTTTIYACLRYLAALGGRHIITVEDPAEQIVPGIMQTEVNEALGLDFAKAARHLLRQDPQALIIGEIRDEETANIAVRAALTGHLVVSTLHAGSCKGVLERLLVICADPSAVVTSLDLLVNQRLLRRLCPACHGQRCAQCLETGYRGRLPLLEWVRVTDVLRPRLAARDFGAVTANPSLAQSAQALVRAGFTDEPEVRRVLGG